MRICSDENEIRSLLKSFIDQRLPLLLWQEKTGERLRFSAQCFEKNQKSGDLKLKVVPEGAQSNLDPESALYVYGDYKSLLFKTSLLEDKKDIVVVSYPKSIRLEELRNTRRFNTYKVPNCMVGIQSKNTMGSYSLRLNDISPKGFSFLVHNNFKEEFGVGDILFLNQVMSDGVKEVRGVVKHISEFERSEKMNELKLKKIGVELSDSLVLSDLHLYRKFLAFT